MNKSLLLSLFLSLGLSACATTLKPAELSETGYFDTSSTLKPEEVIVQENFKDEYKKLVYVKD